MAQKPNRIRLSRAKGWKMPPSTVKVDRSTKWGNPYLVGRRTQARAVKLFRMMLGGVGVLGEEPTFARQREYLMFARAHLHELRGKNLACWCTLSAPCHADVLLEVTNANGQEPIQESADG